MIVVSDTTPLNDLILTETVHVLPAIFGRVCAPSAVIEERSHPRSPEAVRTWASGPPECLDVRDPTHPDPSLKLGPGETAAISPALELEADRVLIDERKGYKAARQRGLEVITTLGIVEEEAHRGLVDFEETVDRLDHETTFYVTEAVLEEFRRRVRERTLAEGRDHQAKENRPNARRRTNVSRSGMVGSPIPSSDAGARGRRSRGDRRLGKSLDAVSNEGFK